MRELNCRNYAEWSSPSGDDLVRLLLTSSDLKFKIIANSLNKVPMPHVAHALRLSSNFHGFHALGRQYQPWRNLMTLAIETSCDDTAVAILEKKDVSITTEVPQQDAPNDLAQLSQTQLSNGTARLLFNEKITSRNTGLGGIHPIEALEHHQTSLGKLVANAVKQLPEACMTYPSRITRTLRLESGALKQLPDFISVTRGPGMRSNLNCGLDTAKGLAAAWQLPLLGVHHMQAHALTPRLVQALENNRHDGEPQPRFPFVTLLISGGHTMLLHSKSLNDHQILATTRDIAIGDALDKCGRTILPDKIKTAAMDTAFAKYLSDYAYPYPDSYKSWPVPTNRAQEIDKPSNRFGWQVQTPLANTKDLAFSFTSIATSIEKLFRSRQKSLDNMLSDEERTCFAQTALGIAFEHLASRIVIALRMLHTSGQDVSTLVVSGGVAANSFLRYFLRAVLDVRGLDQVKLLFPPPWLCTDNAAMIAWCGMEMFEAGYRSELHIGSLKKWSMDSAAEGGILGADGWRQVNDGHHRPN